MVCILVVLFFFDFFFSETSFSIFARKVFCFVWILAARYQQQSFLQKFLPDFLSLRIFFLQSFYQKPSLTRPPSPSDTNRLRPLEGILRTNSSVSIPAVLQRT